MTWVSRALAVAGLLLVGWALVTQLGAALHGHPAYLILLAITAAGSLSILWRNRDGGPRRGPLRLIAAVGLRVLMVGWLFAVWWLCPFTAQEPALAAMQSGDGVTVTESATRIILEPDRPSATGVVFQPGAKVEARAYAAVLRPLAEAGHLVVIVKQPLGIGFLAIPSYVDVRDAYPKIGQWVVGGHSLGGTVASIEADRYDSDERPAVGLLLYASYPGSNISESLQAKALSISGTLDGLATPDDIDASKLNLPEDTTFVAVKGAVHSQFADYGPQPGDGQPTISHDDARTRIAKESVTFVDAFDE